jgi:hypothetical protein
MILLCKYLIINCLQAIVAAIGVEPMTFCLHAIHYSIAILNYSKASHVYLKMIVNFEIKKPHEILIKVLDQC